MLTGRSLSLQGKPACLTLMDDLMCHIETFRNINALKKDSDASHLFNCSGSNTGCPGKIRIRYQNEQIPSSDSQKNRDRHIAAIAGELKSFSIFKTLSKSEIKNIVSHFRIRQFPKNEVLLRKGEPGVKLFIILSGKVDVISDYGTTIATLERGDVFGEMSLLSGNPVSMKVKVASDAKIMYVHGIQNNINTKYKPIICSKAPPDKSPNKLWLRFRYTSTVCSYKIHIFLSEIVCVTIKCANHNSSSFVILFLPL